MVDGSKLDSIKLKLGFPNAICNAVSKLWVLWNDDIQCSVIHRSDQVIGLNCKHYDLEGDFRVVAIYAKCCKIERRVLWSELISLANVSTPLLIGGNFNIVRQASEIVGGNSIDFMAADEFNKCIDDCGLLEI